MFNMNHIKGPFFCFFIILGCLSAIRAQDSLSFEPSRKLFFGINASAVKDFGQQANFFRGANEFGIYELLQIPSVKSELLTKTGKNYTLADYPIPMKYNLGIGIGLNVIYCLEDINIVINGSFSKLTTSGVFTLSADDPANPFGSALIKQEKISGTERRTWLKAGIQLKNEINERNDFFIEIAPMAFFQKAVKNEVNIEGSNYSILYNNPANLTIKSSYNGYGLNLGFGIQTMFLKNKFTQVGLNLSSSKLKMMNTSKLNFTGELYLSVFL